MISVCVCTKKRPIQIRDCIGSILNNSYKQFELIVVDQSSNDLTKKAVANFNNKKIKYYKLKSVGKSKALNFAITKALGEILAFIDDDCIADKYWLKNIITLFNKKGEIAGVFGNVLAYQPQKNIGKICPTTFVAKKPRYISNRQIVHHKSLGLGCNMSIRSNVIKRIGNYKEWLGPGLLGISGGEDSELIFRMLKNNYLLITNPNVFVYHNRWITHHQEQILYGKYTCGLSAVAFFYLLKGDFSALSVLFYRINERIIEKVKIFFKSLIKLDINDLYFNKGDIIYICWECLCILNGCLKALYAFIKERNPLLISKTND